MIRNEQGLRIAKLYHVSVENGKTAQSNKFYFMTEQPDGTTKCEWGRVGKTPKITILSPGEFDEVYREKTGPRKGYQDQTELLVEKTISAPTVKTKTGEVIDIACTYVKSLFNDLMGYANKSIQQNYKVSQEAVTEAQVNAAQALVDEITKDIKIGVNIQNLNAKILKLYTIIPRQMKDVRNHIFQPINDSSSLQKAQRLIANEQDTLDTMAGQVALIKQQRESEKVNEGVAAKKVDLLDQMGLKVVHVTDAGTIKKIKDLMGPNANQFKKAYEVVNSKTEVKYINHVKNASNKKEQLFWHGSRNENWFNILQTGLLIRPAGAVHSGSMFGDGIYGANKAQKSIGYTSLRGSYWASGSDNKAFLALFQFHVGNEKHIHRHDSSCYDLSKSKLSREGFDSVYAHGGIDLRNDEFIVYDANQVTVKYLIEIGN